jgi:hypothetical protein
VLLLLLLLLLLTFTIIFNDYRHLAEPVLRSFATSAESAALSSTVRWVLCE